MAAAAGSGGGETASSADEGGGGRGSPPGSDPRRLGPGGREEEEAPRQGSAGGLGNQSRPSSSPPSREAEVTVDIGETYLCRRGDGTWRKCPLPALPSPLLFSAVSVLGVGKGSRSSLTRAWLNDQDSPWLVVVQILGKATLKSTLRWKCSGRL